MEDFSCVKETEGEISHSQETEKIMANSEIGGPMSSGSRPNNCPELSEKTDTCLNSTQAIEPENARSEYNHKESSGFHSDLELQHPAAEEIDAGGSDPYDGDLNMEGKSICPSAIRQHLLDSSRGEGLKKLDSSNPQMSKEIGDFTDSGEPCMPPYYDGLNWETVENEIGIDVSSITSEGKTNTFMLDPSLSQDQLFSIVDFSPNWTYVGSKTEVLITGRFLKSPDIIENCKWSCMFGEVEVPADVGADGVLRCYTPTHEPGWVHFYVTCSNRLACSEVREFEYRVSNSDNNNGGSSEIFLRFDKLLTLSSSLNSLDTSSFDDISALRSQINSLLTEDTLGRDKFSSDEGYPSQKLEGGQHQKQLKEKLRVWLLQKVAEGGKGPSVLDEGGQGVLHFAAALGYDWAFEPTILAGVNVNFRDVNGWTALHWAASCGRENTVASLISLDADPGALTEPSPRYPLGRTPADLASANGHEGIVECLRKRPMGVPNSFINLDDHVVGRGPKAAQNISEISTTAPSLRNTSDGQSPEYCRIYGADETLPMSKRIKTSRRILELSGFEGSGFGWSGFELSEIEVSGFELSIPDNRAGVGSLLASQMSWRIKEEEKNEDKWPEAEGQLRDSKLVSCLPGLVKAWKRLRLCFGHVRKCCNY